MGTRESEREKKGVESNRGDDGRGEEYTHTHTHTQDDNNNNNNNDSSHLITKKEGETK